MTTRPTPSLKTFARWAQINAPVAKAVIMAQAFAELERERVNTYIRPIFDRYAFVDGMSRGAHLGQPLETPDQIYLSTDEAKVKAYFEECDTAHRAHGFTGPQGHCPALRADNLLIQAQNALIDQAIPLFGIESCDLFGDDRKRYLDLLIGACLKAGKE